MSDISPIEERHTILIVDDDQEIIDTLSEHFRQRNCEAIATTDPITVLDKLRNFQVKLMLLDLKMRGMDGFKVLEKIKESGMPIPPTIVMTGFLPEYKERLATHGIGENDVIRKPFDFQKIEDLINRKLGEQIVGSEVGSEYEDHIYVKNRCKLGILDDADDVLNHLKEFFEERNYQVYCFRRGTEAVEYLRKQQVDILFVDLVLPGVPGDEIIAEITKLPTHPRIFVLTTGHVNPAVINRLKSLGCQDFIEKPFDVIDLIERVKAASVQMGLLG